MIINNASMSIFKEYELPARVYLPVDSDSTKITKYNGYAFEITINIIRISANDMVLEGIQFPEYRASVGGTNASQIVKGALIEVYSKSEFYVVTNEPKYLRLFDEYKIELKKYEGSLTGFNRNAATT